MADTSKWVWADSLLFENDKIRILEVLLKPLIRHNEGDDPKDPNRGYFMKPEEPHSIRNLSNVKIDAFRIEFKPQ